MLKIIWDTFYFIEHIFVENNKTNGFLYNKHHYEVYVDLNLSFWINLKKYISF